MKGLSEYKKKLEKEYDNSDLVPSLYAQSMSLSRRFWGFVVIFFSGVFLLIMDLYISGNEYFIMETAILILLASNFCWTNYCYAKQIKKLTKLIDLIKNSKEDSDEE